MLKIDTTALEAFIEQKVRAAVAEALGDRPEDDPWLGSKAAAAHMGVSLQRIHDLTCAGLLPRYGGKGKRLYFRRSDLDRYMETRGR
jgi:Helix-turn-helix domain